MNSSLSLNQPSASQEVFDVFVVVFVENESAPVFTGTEKGIPLTSKNVFMAQAQQMYPQVRKVALTVLRPSNGKLQRIPDWVAEREFLFPKGRKFTVASKGPSAEFPKVVEFNGVKHRLPKRKKAKKPVSRDAGKRKKKANQTAKQKRASRKPKATRRINTKMQRKSNKRK